MPQSMLVFDFGTNEEAAQQARHKIEGWKQAFRLGNKITLKFERDDSGAPTADAADKGAKNSPGASTGAPGKSKGGSEKKKSAPSKAEKPEKSGEAEKPEPPVHIQLLVRLDFSDHEKLTHHRWLDRIPAEEPFRSAKSEVIRHADPAFASASERFDSLD